jgi:hypothetical protein
MPTKQKPLQIGTRLPNGARVGTCPVCHAPGVIEIGLFETGLRISIDHERKHHEVMHRGSLLVAEVAALCGLKWITVYKAIQRGSIKATRRPGWPISIEPRDFAEYFNRPDGRHKRKEMTA